MARGRARRIGSYPRVGAMLILPLCDSEKQTRLEVLNSILDLNKDFILYLNREELVVTQNARVMDDA